MKQKSLPISAILFLIITVIIFSCSKGPARPTGPAGATGASGATGTTGTANVIYSAWLNVTFQQDANDTNLYAQITAPKLTDSILNLGDIKVYFNSGSDSTNGQFVLALPTYEPFLFSNNSQPATLIANAYYTTDTITIIANYDLSSYMRNGYNYFQFRYILIPGGVTALPASINGTQNAINWNDYNQVKKYLGLKD